MGMKQIKDVDEWLLNYIPPKPKVADKVPESFKNKIKQIYEREIVSSKQHRPNLL